MENEITKNYYKYNSHTSVYGLYLFLEVKILKMVYIASPLRGYEEKNTTDAVRYCDLASEAGVIPLAPHIIFSQWCTDSVPKLRERGLKLGLGLLEKCEELWVMGTVISEGMRGEIEFAKEHDIKTYHIKDPNEQDSYPISADENSLLNAFDTQIGNDFTDFEKQTIILNHENLKPEYRTSLNQIWIATHGPGCNNGTRSETIHLTHPIDKDRLTVGRSDIFGIIKSEVKEAIYEIYGVQEETENQINEEESGDEEQSL